ncbi:unnamed protein product [Rotaria sordida]|uniref:Uncharacterized protein n=2 Tax=Rotaria sordida TaxID=392033 RepID=A0A819XVG9_9BILA|nr:unnamed protein product [Rotaria sordida]
MGRLLSGEDNVNHTSKDDKLDKRERHDKFEDYCKLLKIEKDEIEYYISDESITKTCRTLVSKIIPKRERLNTTWSDIPVDKQQAIYGLARMFHPFEQKTDGELSKACRNVCEIAKCYSRKPK